MYKKDYINHPLNNSPSKQAFSFGKVQRFKPVGQRINIDIYDNKSVVSRYSRCQSADIRNQTTQALTKKQIVFRVQANEKQQKSRQRSRSANRLKRVQQKQEVQFDKRQYGSKRTKDLPKKAQTIIRTEQCRGFKKRPPKPVSSNGKLISYNSKNVKTQVVESQCDLTNGTNGTSNNTKSIKEKEIQKNRNLNLNSPKCGSGFTFSRSPKFKVQKKQSVSPGTYQMVSEFGNCTNYRRRH